MKKKGVLAGGAKTSDAMTTEAAVRAAIFKGRAGTSAAPYRGKEKTEPVELIGLVRVY